MSHNPRLTNNQTIINTCLEKQTTYTYDKQRRVTQITKPSSKTISTTYSNGRVTSIQTDEGTTNYGYACQSNVSQISRGSEKFTFTYDGTLVTSIVQSGLLNQNISYTYNNNFNPISMTYAGQTENYTYNDDGELTSIGAMAIAPYTIRREQGNKLTTLSNGTYTKTTTTNRYGELRRQKDNVLDIILLSNKAGQIVKKGA